MGTARPTPTISPRGAGGGEGGIVLLLGAFALVVGASASLWVAGGLTGAWGSHSDGHGWAWRPGPFSPLLVVDFARHPDTYVTGQGVWAGTDPRTLVGVAVVVLLAAAVPAYVILRSFTRASRRAPDPGRLMATVEDVKHLTQPELAKRASKLRPSLSGIKPKDLQGAQVGFTIGRLSPAGRLIRGSWEDVVLMFMAPRSGKTSSYAIPLTLEAPGAVVQTSNKPDGYTATAALRASDTSERVWAFDPQQIVRAPQTWWWDPLRAITTVEEAERLAAHFINATGTDNKDDIWKQSGAELVASLLLAAAVSGGTLADVYTWVTQENSPLPAQLLRQAGWDAIASSLDGTRTMAEETRSGVFFNARSALACLRNPEITAWVTPPTGQDAASIEEFDAKAFPASRQTLYLLSKDGGGSAAPLVAALTDRVLREAVAAAERRPGGRLDAPMLVVLDEAANICRIGDLPQLYSHLGSRGIIPVTVLQSYAQGVGVWGETGMKALWGAATLKIVGSGIDDPNFADDLSKLVGDYDYTSVSVSRGDGKSNRSRSVQTRRILTAADVRALPKFRTLVFSTGARPALVRSIPFFEGPRAEEIGTATATADARIEAAAEGAAA
ncbi:type IV secretory system conjugative DNA transfer family protein [Motilibacter aurantiacus]|uniref:type IV secretory system conjugative DNA transfer family protein n=1 Tax=Motilibacter aurantiacus TaxID=2714955 RepID=UPI00140B678D|nr:type IV secretory system conjugative DNA transfer family protein [Motilibacter aurantiacus]NHC47158.1 TraM recognition domain-containing protein [Motilibacter aurantiacus]